MQGARSETAAGKPCIDLRHTKGDGLVFNRNGGSIFYSEEPLEQILSTPLLRKPDLSIFQQFCDAAH